MHVELLALLPHTCDQASRADALFIGKCHHRILLHRTVLRTDRDMRACVRLQLKLRHVKFALTLAFRSAVKIKLVRGLQDWYEADDLCLLDFFITVCIWNRF